MNIINIFTILPLIILIVISRVIIIIGSVLLKMTGLDDASARFQALSAFTGTGFTTKEAEMVMRSARRRRIISMLMILGYVGMASGIATILLSFVRGNFVQLSIKFFILIIFIVIIFFIIFTPAFQTKLMKFIEKYIRKKRDLKPAKIENILNFAEGYRISEIFVYESLSCVGKSLSESKLREKGILVLAIERPGEFIPAPNADTVINSGDTLICYGNIDSMKKITRTRK